MTAKCWSSAGNSGPGDATVGSPGDAPWITTVGASTHDRAFLSHLQDLSGGATSLDDITGLAIAAGYGPADIVDAADFPNPNDPGGDPRQCLEPYPEGTFDGEIVLCERGAIARVSKGANVLAGGAGGMVLMNEAATGDSLNADAHFLPAVHIAHNDGLALIDWLANGEDHQATISGTEVTEDDDFGSIMAAFSSRGPSRAVDTHTPDVTAPGVDIVAAYGVGDEIAYNSLGGTSMSSPHVAGAAALLRQLRGHEWTPAEMQSALMTTANRGVTDHDGEDATSFAMGAGEVDLRVAAQAGLVLDESIQNYIDANPDEGGDPKELNLASMANSLCLQQCSFTRTVRGTVDSAVEWTVTTESEAGLTIDVDVISFTLADDAATQQLQITADVEGAPIGEYLFGWVILTPDDGDIPTARLPLAVVPTTGILPGVVDIDTRRDAGSQLVADLQAIEIDDLRLDAHGLVRGNVVAAAVPQDPDNSNPYSHLDDVWWTTVTVPADAKRLIAEITETTSPDLDLFVGQGVVPSAAGQVCASTAPHSFERCDIADPDAGTWWILVQNWLASGDEPDPFTLSHAVVPDASSGNLDLDGPAQVDEFDPFDVRVYFDEPTLQPGETWYGAFSIGSDAASPGDVGTVALDLHRHEDDVSKTASVEEAALGETVTYEIVVEPNVTPADLEYTLTDTIPDGMTYVEGSVTGGATVEDGVVAWTGSMISPVNAEVGYDITTNAEDPMCDTGFGGYVDLRAFGIFPQALQGDAGSIWTTFTSGLPFHFFGEDYPGISFTGAPLAIFDAAANFGGSPWFPQELPDPALPNNLIAMLWQDLETIHDPDLDRGISLAAAGDNVVVIDYRGLQFWQDDDGPRFDVQLVMERQPGPFGREIAIAFNRLEDLSAPFTIGAENADGTRGDTLVNLASPAGIIDSDTVVCMTLESELERHVITYDVTVDGDASGHLTNVVEHDVDNPGSQPVTTTATVFVPEPTPDPQIVLDGPDEVTVGSASEGFSARVFNAGEVGLDENVEVTFIIGHDTEALSVGDVTLEYWHEGAWVELALSEDDGELVGRFGPAEGWELPADYDATTLLRATFQVAGDHTATASVVGIDTSDIYDTDTHTVTVKAARYVPLVPERILDTRDATGDVEGRIGPGQVVSQQVAGVGSVPSDASAVAVNVTAVGGTSPSHLRVWPSGEPMPNASTINFQPGVNIANMVIVEVGDDGKVDIYNHAGEVDVIFDVVGYFP